MFNITWIGDLKATSACHITDLICLLLDNIAIFSLSWKVKCEAIYPGTIWNWADSKLKCNTSHSGLALVGLCLNWYGQLNHALEKLFLRSSVFLMPTLSKVISAHCAGAKAISKPSKTIMATTISKPHCPLGKHPPAPCQSDCFWIAEEIHQTSEVS